MGVDKPSGDVMGLVAADLAGAGTVIRKGQQPIVPTIFMVSDKNRHSDFESRGNRTTIGWQVH